MGRPGVISILIVEDEIITARDIESKLQKIGYEVCDIASSGQEAIEKAGEHMPDLVLMDITIEGDIDGVKTAETIYNLYQIPFIYVTAHTDLNTLHRAKLTEPQGYIVKPFSPRDLIITIGMALYKHKMEMKLKALTQMLKVFLMPISMEEKLKRALALIVSIPRLFLQTKGAIYTKDPNGQFTLKASLDNSSCYTVHPGTCLCGKALESRQVVHADRITKEHTLHQDELPHGHYCVPIVAGDQLLGLINVYLREGHPKDEADINMLNTFADVIANALNPRA